MSDEYGTTLDIDRFIAVSASYFGLSPMQPDALYGRRQARLNERMARTKPPEFAHDKRSQLHA